MYEEYTSKIGFFRYCVPDYWIYVRSVLARKHYGKMHRYRKEV